MAARTKSNITPKYKTKYKVRNWPAYEESLRKRGDITVWFDEAAVAAWKSRPSDRPGGQQKYSEPDIATLDKPDISTLGLQPELPESLDMRKWGEVAARQQVDEAH